MLISNIQYSSFNNNFTGIFNKKPKGKHLVNSNAITPTRTEHKDISSNEPEFGIENAMVRAGDIEAKKDIAYIISSDTKVKLGDSTVIDFQEPDVKARLEALEVGGYLNIGSWSEYSERCADDVAPLHVKVKKISEEAFVLTPVSSDPNSKTTLLRNLNQVRKAMAFLTPGMRHLIKDDSYIILNTQLGCSIQDYYPYKDFSSYKKTPIYRNELRQKDDYEAKSDDSTIPALYVQKVNDEYSIIEIAPDFHFPVSMGTCSSVENIMHPLPDYVVNMPIPDFKFAPYEVEEALDPALTQNVATEEPIEEEIELTLVNKQLNYQGQDYDCSAEYKNGKLNRVSILYQGEDNTRGGHRKVILCESFPARNFKDVPQVVLDLFDEELSTKEN